MEGKCLQRQRDWNGLDERPPEYFGDDEEMG